MESVEKFKHHPQIIKLMHLHGIRIDAFTGTGLIREGRMCYCENIVGEYLENKVNVNDIQDVEKKTCIETLVDKKRCINKKLCEAWYTQLCCIDIYNKLKDEELDVANINSIINYVHTNQNTIEFWKNVDTQWSEDDSFETFICKLNHTESLLRLTGVNRHIHFKTGLDANIVNKICRKIIHDSTWYWQEEEIIPLYDNTKEIYYCTEDIECVNSSHEGIRFPIELITCEHRPYGLSEYCKSMIALYQSEFQYELNSEIWQTVSVSNNIDLAFNAKYKLSGINLYAGWEDLQRQAYALETADCWIVAPPILGEGHYYVRQVSDEECQLCEMVNPHNGTVLYFNMKKPHISFEEPTKCMLCNNYDKKNMIRVIRMDLETGQNTLKNALLQKKLSITQMQLVMALAHDPALKHNVRDLQRLFRPQCGMRPIGSDDMLMHFFSKVENSMLLVGRLEYNTFTKAGILTTNDMEICVAKLNNGKSAKPFLIDNIKSIEAKMIYNEKYNSTRQLLFKFQDMNKEQLGINAGVFVIDVTTMEMVTLTNSMEYIAISHSWGKWQQAGEVELLEGVHTVPVLSADAGFSSVKDIAKQVRLRGVNYMWLDWLCVDQNDLSTQAAVYSNAKEVIVILRGVESRLLTMDPSIIGNSGVLTILQTNRWMISDWTVQEYWHAKHIIVFNIDGCIIDLEKWFQVARATLDENIARKVPGLSLKLQMQVSSEQLLSVAQCLFARDGDFSSLRAYQFLHPSLQVEKIARSKDYNSAMKQMISATQSIAGFITNEIDMPKNDCAWVLKDISIINPIITIPILSRFCFSGGLMTIAHPIRIILTIEQFGLAPGCYLVMGIIGGHIIQSDILSSDCKLILMNVSPTKYSRQVWHANSRNVISISQLIGIVIMQDCGGVLRVGFTL